MKAQIRKLLVALGSILITIAAHAQGTAFTYQGRLADNGAPANGLYDFRFTVYDALSGGNTVGSVADADDVGVTNGLFTVAIDPGASVFTGPARWLEVAVRAGASLGVYTNLVPRQALTATPYAVKAINADTAATAGTANSVANGAITAASIANGAIGSAQLASGAAAANLAASGQAGVASGGFILSDTENTALLNAGYGYRSLPVVGAVAMLVAVAVALASHISEWRSNATPPMPAAAE